MATTDKKLTQLIINTLTAEQYQDAEINEDEIYLVEDDSYTNEEIDALIAQAGGSGKQDKITGAATTITDTNLTADRVVVSNSNGKIDISSVTSTELNYMSGVTSNIQTQLNGKQATITGAASSITINNLTADRAVVADNEGKITVSPITSTELSYLDGVTSNIQTQLTARANVDLSNLSTIGQSKLDAKQDKITGGASTIAASNLTSSRALVSDTSGKVSVSAVTSTELSYLDGVTSGIQTQLNAKALKSELPTVANNSSIGLVKPDNDSIKIDSNGVITANGLKTNNTSNNITLQAWVGTKAQYEQQYSSGSIPSNMLCIITDD